ncbi:carbohydrate sulfotransferase 12-like [Mya arenaria]|uniref:carbohydrate sulfotransferase 12-like n=1 Tax=Mya arenaria TaxID=6604 RepID=UPI0022E2D76C|nr:carbohydrate sulfotransferase 12-like [Mya arenaria]
MNRFKLKTVLAFIVICGLILMMIIAYEGLPQHFTPIKIQGLREVYVNNESTQYMKAVGFEQLAMEIKMEMFVEEIDVEHDLPQDDSRTKITINNNVNQKQTSSQRAHSTDEIKLIRDRFKTRRRILYETCYKYESIVNKHLPCELKATKFDLKYVEDGGLIYCAIPKTGSTFWKRVMHVIGGWENTTNPIEIRPEDADKVGGFSTMNDKNITEIREVLGISKTVMFVRDPFTRLFSAWLDKFYSPNPYYWKYGGTNIVTRQRFYAKNTTEENSKEGRKGAVHLFEASLSDDKKTEAANTKTQKLPVKCGYDVSFEEFISYVVGFRQNSTCLDEHFSPNYKHCLPCTFEYKYIGNYETFKEETLFLLNELNLTEKVKFQDFEKDANLDAITDLAEWVFQQEQEIEQCGVTFRCALFRTFKRLQSRGVISKSVSFPYDNNTDIHNITKYIFRNDLLRLSRIGTKAEKRKNREESILKAFKSIPEQLMEKTEGILDNRL